MRRFLLFSVGAILLLCGIGVLAFWLAVRQPDPVTAADRVDVPRTTLDGEGRWRSGPNWLGRNEHGLWEMYVEGDALERGLTHGALAGELVRRQEEIFIGRIKQIVPDQAYLGYLKYFVAWFDRKLDDHVPLEYRREIFGVSRAMGDGFDFVGPKYHRALNYHAAHDIGHALQDLAMVGCTSFAAWGAHTSDGGLLVARNFDFSMGEDFACDKLVSFIAPDDGIPFLSVGWGGFVGVVSGMNLEGLTVTINAARSEVPSSARTPISLLAREILQHARTIDEAVSIARSREVFVSESILVSSASDGRAVIIEKAPDGMHMFTPKRELLVCANHYQSSTFKDTEANRANMRESDSMGRYRRMTGLAEAAGALDPVKAAGVLRDRSAPDGSDVGMGNPMSLNQLMAHHAVIFQPEKRLAWVSAGPYQLGAFVCYDLRAVFARSADGMTGPANVDTLTIPADHFLSSPAMQDFTLYQRTRELITDHVIAGTPFHLGAEQEQAFIAANPRCYLTYEVLGDLHRMNGANTAAAGRYRQALDLTVSSAAERARIEERLKACAKN